MSAQPVFLDPTDESVGELLQRGISGPITMLNLLRFRDWADYTNFPEAAPPNPISGRDAYDRYISHTMPFLTATGGSIRLPRRRGTPPRGPPRRAMGSRHGRATDQHQ